MTLPPNPDGDWSTRFALGWIVPLLRFLVDSIGSIVAAGGATVAGIGAALQSGGGAWDWLAQPSGRLILLGGILSIVGVVIQSITGRRISTLEATNATLAAEVEDYKTLIQASQGQSETSHFDHVSRRLGRMFKSLGYSSTERISVYRYAENEFNMIGRHSSNPEFAKRGRGVYPADSGCIGKAWRHAEASDLEIPDPEVDLEAYAEHHREHWGIDPEVSRSFVMKSVELAAFALGGSENSAVIVLESVKSGRINVVSIRGRLKRKEGDELGDYIELLRNLEPTASVARREGF